MRFISSLAVLSLLASSLSFASSGHGTSSADAHAPIGIMGDHLHKQGEWMMSYRFMRMNMEGNVQGSNDISAEQIATTITNPFFGRPGMPPTLRVVPTKMTTDMHMLGFMYAPSDRVTLMAMFNHTTKEMDHLTFQGGVGNTVLTQFTTKVSGIGDTKISALVGLYKKDSHSLHANLGLSLPTGSIDKTDTVTAPNGATPTLRVPYAMQLGSGTYDLEPGITYNGHADKLGWGAQVKAIIRLSDNDEHYSLGDQQNLSAWLSYSVLESVSLSSRLSFTSLDAIDGQDANIVAPVQTANPENYGGNYTDLALGANFINHNGHRVALEYQRRINQQLNGVQLEMDDMLTLGYQYAF